MIKLITKFSYFSYINSNFSKNTNLLLFQPSAPITGKVKPRIIIITRIVGMTFANETSKEPTITMPKGERARIIILARI